MPIETKGRELHGRLLLSCVAIEHGMTAILGQIQELRQQMSYLAPGIYVSKSASKHHAKEFAAFKRLGHRIVAWDEEGLVFPSVETYQTQKVWADSLESVDWFFAWGRNQVAAILDIVPSAQRKMLLTGNPRFDVLRAEYRSIHQEEVQKIKDRFGDFILINGTFARYNHYLGIEGQFENLTQSGQIRNDNDKQFYSHWIIHNEKQFHAFQSLVDTLRADFPELAIVIRPHPSENLSVWNDFAQKRENVNAVFEGSAIPWILASRIMLHGGCTTGIESYFLDHPALCYRAAGTTVYDPELPSLLNYTAYTESELCNLLTKTLNGELPALPKLDQSAVERVRIFIENYEQELASDKIGQNLAELYQAQDIEDPASARLVRFVRQIKRVTKKLLSGGDGGALQEGAGYRSQKFPGLTREELQHYIDKFSRATGRFSNITAKPVKGTKTCFRIYSTRPA